MWRLSSVCPSFIVMRFHNIYIYIYTHTYVKVHVPCKDVLWKKGLKLKKTGGVGKQQDRGLEKMLSPVPPSKALSQAPAPRGGREGGAGLSVNRHCGTGSGAELAGGHR